MYFFKYTYKQNCCANYFHKQSAQAEKKYHWRKMVGYLSPTIAFSSFLMTFAVSPRHVEAFAKK